MQRVRAKAPGGKAHAVVLLAIQVDFAAALNRQESVEFDDERPTSRVSRPFPNPFRASDQDLQTK